ncbi:ABC transporter substrate-binding protein [Mesorhizobium sp. ES1-4]|uniref:ABC transporter substrate-binding protein n=1 Tax=Mesorhizobium sp. ES1-4 TaxID=2876627 RepID=UPI001CC94576|nr:ABC transporter substrate-binding protein [Mesorhizobium sp. ES1-4]MBZ9798319.1 ABC transporter substrate-binding protein [Mesorhizobium sp. ES1-4]
MRATLATLCALALLLFAGVAGAVEGDRVFFKSQQVQSAVLTIHAATDLDAMRPLVLDFQQIAPGVSVEFSDYVTNDLFREAEQACRQGSGPGDILLSSSVDQLVKLANDGCALQHVSAEARSAPAWADWREEVYGFTFEPAVIVYDSTKVPPRDVPHTHDELADLLRREPEVYRGRIGTYDVAASGIGYLLAFNDARQAPTIYGRLLESFSRAEAVKRCCNAEVLGEVANGNIRIAYNILGSYAYAAYRKNPNLKIVVPRDYALILSRGVMIPTTSGNPDLAARFLDYLLSERGQRVAREQAFFFSEKSPLPDGVDGPAALMESGIGRPIRIGPALLAAQDRILRERFIADWASLIAKPLN